MGIVLKATNQDTANAGVLQMSAIVETLPLTEERKLVELEIVGAGALADITLYKELVKSI